MTDPGFTHRSVNPKAGNKALPSLHPIKQPLSNKLVHLVPLGLRTAPIPPARATAAGLCSPELLQEPNDLENLGPVSLLSSPWLPGARGAALRAEHAPVTLSIKSRGYLRGCGSNQEEQNLPNQMMNLIPPGIRECGQELSPPPFLL